MRFFYARMPALVAIMRVFLLEGWAMGKSKRAAHWREHEQAADQVERVKSKPLRDDKAKAWKKACVDYLTVNHFCQDCSKRGYTSPAEQVAHIEQPAQSQVKFWNIDNWQALCEPCFQRITGGQTLTVHETIPKDAKLYTVK